MSDIEHNGCIGHPVTNLLMQADADRLAERQAKATKAEPAPKAAPAKAPRKRAPAKAKATA